MLSLIISNCSKIIGRFSTRMHSNSCPPYSSIFRVARLSTDLKIEKKKNGSVATN